MGLQVKRTGSEDFGRFIKMLSTGEPGTGKTLTGSTWPNPLFLNAEGGLLSLQDRDIPYTDIKSSDDLLDAKDKLSKSAVQREKEFGVPVDTVVIDTIDEVGRLLIKERLLATNKDTMAIQDWGWYGEQLRDVIRAYRNLPLNVVFNCHIKSQTDEETGKMFLRPSIQGAVGDEIAGYVDLAVVLTSRTMTETVDNKPVKRIRRYIQTFPDSRQPWVKDRSGRLPMELEINFEDDYQRIYDYVFGGRKTSAAPVAVAEPEKKTTASAQSAPKVEEKPAEAPAKKRAAKATKAAPETKKEPEKAVEETPPESVEEPEAEVPEPEEVQEPETTGASEETNDSEETEDDAAPEEGSVPSSDTAAESSDVEKPVDDPMVCDDCGGAIETKDQSDLSFIRLKRHACKSCFREARSRKSA